MLQIGFDIGGTNIKAGVVHDNMKILCKRSVSFPSDEGYQKVAAILAELVRDMAKELNRQISDFQSIGIAAPGSIDAASTMILNAHNLGFHNVPLKAEMNQYFPDTKVYLANDADAAALAELCAGAFRGCKTAVLLTLGTGVGGGVILGGRMFKGGMGHGIELGHMIIQHGGPLCTCGNRGCMESLCSATALIREGRKVIEENIESMIFKQTQGDESLVTAKLVLDCAKEGDSAAYDIFENYVDCLSSAIVSCMSLLDPEVIALGGGVSLAGEFLFEPLRKLTKMKSFFKVDQKIVPAELGNDAGFIGAAMLAGNEEKE